MLPVGTQGQRSRIVSQNQVQQRENNDVSNSNSSNQNNISNNNDLHDDDTETRIKNNQTCTSNKSFQNTIHQYTTKRQKWKSQLFGQKLGQKEDGICRIVSHNINCLGLHTNSRYKSDILKEWLLQNNVDVCGLQETGIAQHMLKRHEKIAERMRDHRRDNIRMSSVNNRHESVEKLQFGGTAVFAYDYISHLVRSSGAD